MKIRDVREQVGKTHFVAPQINDLTNMTTITMFTKFFKKEPNYG